MTDVLQRIMARKAERLDEARRARPLAELERAIARGRRRASSGFRERLGRADRVNVIAEVKRASPSRGVIRADLDPVEVGVGYAPHAAAISVLTEEDHFLGSLDVLRRLGERVDVPLLRKDFIFDTYQLYEAAEAGADAVLLIVAALDRPTLARLIGEAEAIGLDAFVEVHTPKELRTVVDCGHSLIGCNNRDLKTFDVDLSTSYHLASISPESTVMVSESGIESRETIASLRAAGFSAFLIGEHLMRSPDPGDALRALIA